MSAPVPARLVVLTAGTAALPEYRWAARPVPSMTDHGPAVTVRAVPGPGGQPSAPGLDPAQLDVDVWAAGDAQADAASAAVYAWATRDLPGLVVTTDLGRAVVAAVRASTSPHDRPTDSPDLARIGMTLAVVIHS